MCLSLREMAPTTTAAAWHADMNTVSARVECGVLTICIKKQGVSDTQTKRRIPISSSAAGGKQQQGAIKASQ